MAGIEKVKQNNRSNIKHVVGVVSGKGGVGKSTVTSLLAVELAKAGKKVGIIDADITGPSIPRAFGVKETYNEGELLIPPVAQNGIKVMSINLFLEDETDPILYRGPIISNTVKQFFTDVAWGDIDYMLVDMPPGTSDVALTVFQSIPLDGVIIVTSPQALVEMIVKKAIKMAGKMDIDVLGIVENMSYVICPDCNKKMEIFGKSGIEDLVLEYNIDTFAKLPIRSDIANAMDKGEVDKVEENEIKPIVERIMQI